MKLEVAVADISQVKKDLMIEVAAEEVKAEFARTYEAYSRYVKVPGFRPGRVPLGVVKQRFSKDIKDEVIGRLLPHALNHAIQDHKLNVIGEPSLDEVDLREGEPFKFKVSVEVLPEFELRDYKGLKATKRLAAVGDEAVDRIIDRWCENQAEFVTVEDRASADGDFVSVNLVGKYVGEPEGAEDLEADNVEVELGAEGVQEEFNQSLRSVRSGDVRQFRVVYPENFTSPGLAGKTLDFTATVVAVRRKELPEVDQEFAREMGYDSVDEMRARVRENLEAGAERDATSRLRDDIIEQILASYDFEIPASLIAKQAADRSRELLYMMLQSGMSPNSIRELDWSKRMDEARTLAVNDVRAALVLSRIAEVEGIRVGADEIDAEIERMASSRGETPEQLKARLTKDDALSSIENRLRFNKAVDHVINLSEITVEELVNPPEASPQEPPAAESTGDGNA